MSELYIVVELQKTNGVLSHIITDHSDISQAYYQFHYSSAFAAVSEVDMHAVSLIGEDGNLIDRSIYLHSEQEGEDILDNYIVIEYQITDQPSKIVTTHSTLQDAQYKFHTVAASASISNVPKHLVMALGENGFPVENTVFIHTSQKD